ncbi:MAG: ribonuclease Z [Chloroflexota bacterium]|nr:ribonuclease Z [Chloroflexota bacterium]
MMPLPDRPLSATLIRSGSETILFDCGENTQVNWRASGFAFRTTSTILLSHLHADHIAGLPGVLFQIAHAGRTEPLTIYGPERTAEIVSHLTAIVGRLPYELHVIELAGGDSLNIPAGFTLSTLALQHRMPCLGYRLDLPRAARFDPERATALGVPISDWSRLQRGETVNGIAPDQVLGRPRRGLRVALITDTSLFDTLPAFAADSDLLICEAMYADDDDTDRAKQRGHLTARQSASLAATAQVRHLWLTHFSPSVENLADITTIAQEEFLTAVTGVPGLAITLTFDDGNRESGVGAGSIGSAG